MRKILFVALAMLAATAARAEEAAQLLPVSTVMEVTGTPKINAPDGQSIYVTNTKGEVTSARTGEADVCVYASHIIPLGAVITYNDGSTQVCARGKQGPRFMDLAASAGA